MKITETNVKNAKRRGMKPEDLAGCITELTDDDRRFLIAWLGFHPIVPEAFEIAEMLCEPGSRAAEELDELFEDVACAWEDEEAHQAPCSKPQTTAHFV